MFPKSITRRNLFARGVLLITLFLFSAIASSDKAFAICYAEEHTDRYYSDGTFTDLVGECVENGCTGSFACWGHQTDFVKGSTRALACPKCFPK
jgi:hypothetical protein